MLQCHIKLMGCEYMTNADEVVIEESNENKSVPIRIGIIGSGRAISMQMLAEHIRTLTDEPILCLDIEGDDDPRYDLKNVEGVIVVDSLNSLATEFDKLVLSTGIAPINDEVISQMQKSLNYLAPPPRKDNKKQKTWKHWQDRRR